MPVNIHEAKSRLSRLGELAMKGEKVVIAKAGKLYLVLVPYRGPSEPRKPGSLKGKIQPSEDFDRAPEEMVEAFRAIRMV